MNAKWPAVGEINELQIKRSCYLMDAAHSFRIFLKNYLAGQRAQKGKAAPPPVEKPTIATIWVAKTFPPWQSCVLTTMKSLYDVSTTISRLFISLIIMLYVCRNMASYLRTRLFPLNCLPRRNLKNT